jgi:RND superfamily putative drug exporter
LGQPVLKAVGELCTRYPRRVLAFWGTLLLLALPLAERVGVVLTTDSGVAPGSEAQLVKRTLLHEFSGNNNYQLVLVASSHESGGGAESNERARHAAQFSRLLAEVRALPAVARVTDSTTPNPLPLPELTENAQSAALITLSGRNKAEAERITGHVQELVQGYTQKGGLELLLTGSIPVDREINAISAQDSLRAELFGLPLSLVVLSVAFGALIAASLPLLVAVLSVTLSLAVLFLLGQLFTFATFAQIVITMLGLATGIDYALLMVNRFREELPRVGDPARAAQITTLTAGKAVTFSGLTVLTALTALLVPPLAFVQSIGVASLIVMFFSVVVSLTALPAALTLLGPRVNSLRFSRMIPGSRSRPFWQAQAQAVTKRPLLWTVLGVSGLLLLALPLLRMEVAFSGVRGLTQETETRRAQMILEELDLDSLLRSFDVLADFGERGFYHPSSVRSVASFSRAAAELAGVSQTLTPTTAGGLPPLFVSGYYATQETAATSPLAQLAQATVSRSGRYALLRVFPESDLTPSSAAALERNLRELAQGAGLSVQIGGGPVIEREWASVLYRSFPYAVGLVYLATFVLLGLAFRSVLIPLKSILLNTLTVGAAFGVITAVFQLGWGASLFGLPGGLGFVETSVPIFIFAIVFGLSMDYEVFLVARIVEHHDQGVSDRDAVVQAVGATGGVITSAALIMSVVFFVFLFSHVVLIKTLSLGLTVAVLLDATLVRLVLVPAVMMLAGRWNWWLPRPVARFAKRVDLGHD